MKYILYLLPGLLLWAVVSMLLYGTRWEYYVTWHDWLR